MGLTTRHKLALTNERSSVDGQPASVSAMVNSSAVRIARFTLIAR
jgi:hypothetical protein